MEDRLHSVSHASLFSGSADSLERCLHPTPQLEPALIFAERLFLLIPDLHSTRLNRKIGLCGSDLRLARIAIDRDEIACCAAEKIVHHISFSAASQHHHRRRLSKMVFHYDPYSATRIHRSRYHAVEPFPGVSEGGINLSRQPIFFPARRGVLQRLEPLH